MRNGPPKRSPYRWQIMAPVCFDTDLRVTIIGVHGGGGEYTDAIWVHWSQDLNTWDVRS